MFIVQWDKAQMPAVNTAEGYKQLNGPCNFWLASTDNVKGDLQWFRIKEVGYDPTNGWCTDTIRNVGQMVVPMPKDIPNGNYLFRTEVIDLSYAGQTNAADPTMGAQFYSDCIKYTLTGAQDPKPVTDGLVTLANAYNLSDKSLLLNLTADGKPPGGTYTVPGPVVHPQPTN
ncbi:hypothetical protein GGI21_002240 [Coemansia aciculifera]|nr:hypothetical protein GGI21_002240 [Coemansia aciculifera]